MHHNVGASFNDNKENLEEAIDHLGLCSLKSGHASWVLIIAQSTN
jgi:hypothetical protein